MKTDKKEFLKITVLLVIIFLIINFFSCEKEIESYYLTDEEKALVMLYEQSDTIKLMDHNENIFKFYIDEVDSGIAESDFLGIPQYKSEWIDLELKMLNEASSSGSIRGGKPEGLFDYGININFPEINYDIDYRDKEKYSYKLQKKNQLEIDGIIYQDVYIFNNATSEKAEPTQIIYLNTEYGFLKLEDLEKDRVYTIVRK